MSASFAQSWFGQDMKESIVISNSDFILIESGKKIATVIGRTQEESKEKLKDMNKAKNFPDFMNE